MRSLLPPYPNPEGARAGAPNQAQLLFDEGKGLSTAEQHYAHTAIIKGVRQQVDKWRSLPSPNPRQQWQVTPETANQLTADISRTKLKTTPPNE